MPDEHLPGRENVRNVVLDLCDPFKNLARDAELGGDAQALPIFRSSSRISSCHGRTSTSAMRRLTSPR